MIGLAVEIGESSGDGERIMRFRPPVRPECARTGVPALLITLDGASSMGVSMSGCGLEGCS